MQILILIFRHLGTRYRKHDGTILTNKITVINMTMRDFMVIRYRICWRTACSEWLGWIDFRIWLNEFEIFNDFEWTKKTLKTVLWIVQITCKNVSRKPCINREANIKSPQFSYSITILEKTTKFLAFVTPPYIYHCLSTCKTFWYFSHQWILEVAYVAMLKKIKDNQ